jgi:hypothetical protein
MIGQDIQKYGSVKKGVPWSRENRREKEGVRGCSVICFGVLLNLINYYFVIQI